MLPTAVAWDNSFNPGEIFHFLKNFLFKKSYFNVMGVDAEPVYSTRSRVLHDAGF